MPQDFSPEQKTTLQEILGKRAPYNIKERPNGLPDVPPPAGFLPDPDQRALDPLTAQMLFRYLQVAPELRRSVKKVTKGPTVDSMNFALTVNPELKEGFKIPMHAMPGNLGGIVDAIGGGRITLNHQQPRDQLDYTLGHELGHLTGLKHDDPELDRLEDTLNPGMAKRSRAFRDLLRGTNSK